MGKILGVNFVSFLKFDKWDKDNENNVLEGKKEL
jgi:hypothetical protein